MFKKYLIVVLVTMIVGCASVPMANKEVSNKVKQFSKPTEGNAGVYIYRGFGPGTALKKDIWIDEVCIGESAPNIFFYKEVKGGIEHKISTESEFSPNDLFLTTASGENYFINQYIKMGAFVGGANLEVVSEEKGKKAISSLDLAIVGNCSSQYKK